MRVMTRKSGLMALLAVSTLPLAGSLAAQTPPPAPAQTMAPARDPNIIVNGELPDLTPTGPGPEIKGTITGRNAGRIKIATLDGSNPVVFVNGMTKVKAGGGLFSGGGNYTPAQLMPGLPVTVKTAQTANGLVATQVVFKNGDMKVANMIHNGTNERFEQQAAATEALRGRMGDIDKYNIKGTTNVFFDTGKYALTPNSKAELCQAAAGAEATDNALLLVVGYTDSVGGDEYNQTLSEKRASSVINYLQQVCHWKPYRMLTPTGMAKADPLADNSTPEGKAQNRRVAVNVLVSKSVDGL